MSHKTQCNIVWLLLVIDLHYGQCCGPAEIDQQYTIQSIAKVLSDAHVRWQVNVVSLYDSALSNPVIYQNKYFGTRTMLTIRNVTKNDGKAVFKHTINDVIVYTCALSVYKKASTPRCENMALTDNQIRTKCMTTEVFPRAKCQFTLHNGRTDKRIITEDTPYIAYTHTDPQPDENEYYSTSCTLEYPVNGLKLGDWTVQVNMYPDLTGVSLAQGTTGQAPNSVPLYGPEEVTISLADNQLREIPNEPLNLCSSEGLDVIVICAVKQDDVYNELTLHDFTLTKPNTINTKENYLDRSDRDYQSVNKLKINSGGNHTLICEVRNPKISDIKQTQSMNVQVRKSPSDPPVVSVKSNQHGNVLVQGDDVTVTCSVFGGNPPVLSVTLSCGQDQAGIDGGTSVRLMLHNIGLSQNETYCTCQATHVTGCYDYIGVLPLTVLSADSKKADENTGPFTTAELAGGIVGAIIGTLVLVAFIALVVFVVRREKGKRRNRTEDTDYDKIRRQAPLPYQNVKPRDTTYQEMDSSDQAPNSASVNQETDRTYRNQAYGDYEEPIELDTNAYSDIQTD